MIELEVELENIFKEKKIAQGKEKERQREESRGKKQGKGLKTFKRGTSTYADFQVFCSKRV